MALHTHKESAVDRKERLKWEAESDLRHLREVEDIKRDPARMERAQVLAQKEMRALKKVGGKPTARKRPTRKKR